LTNVDQVWCDMCRPLYPWLEDKRLLDQRDILMQLYEACLARGREMYQSEGMDIYLEYLTWWKLQYVLRPNPQI
jgi:hypothetical protein